MMRNNPLREYTKRKVEQAIGLLRKYEHVALALNGDGYYLAFSGGKDSQLLYLIAELSGVKFKAYFSNTTNELPENIKFMRKYYPMVEFLNPAENFYKLISRKGLPTIKSRYCCAILKEKAGAGYAVLTGERSEESAKRKKYSDVSIQSRNVNRNRVVVADEIVRHECIQGKDKLRIRPILNFSESEVWEILACYQKPFNPCYAMQSRVGCILCPFAKKSQIESHLRNYPKIKSTLLKNLQIYLDKKNGYFESAEECFEWWLQKKSIEKYLAEKKQLNLF